MAEKFIANPTMDQIPFESLQDIYRLWQKAGEEFGYAERKHFTPKMLKEHLPYLTLIDHECDSGRFKVRLIGTHYTEAIGFESTGMYIDELPNTETMLERYNWLVREKAPYYAYVDQMRWADRDYRHYAVLGCPLFDVDKNVNMILFRVTFERADDSTAVSPLL